jgi:hypothetical protein
MEAGENAVREGTKYEEMCTLASSPPTTKWEVASQHDTSGRVEVGLRGRHAVVTIFPYRGFLYEGE